MTDLTASKNGCEEASPLSHDHYIPCNAPVNRLVFLKGDAAKAAAGIPANDGNGEA